MYVYSFAPWGDTSGTHMGLYIWLMFMVVAIAIATAVIISDDVTHGGRFWTLATMILLGINTAGVWSESYNSPPENIRVAATQVDMEAEGYNERRGKRNVDVHNLYGVYKLDTGEYVTMEIYPGRAYPKRVWLYRNKE